MIRKGCLYNTGIHDLGKETLLHLIKCVSYMIPQDYEDLITKSD